MVDFIRPDPEHEWIDIPEPSSVVITLSVLGLPAASVELTADEYDKWRADGVLMLGEP